MDSQCTSGSSIGESTNHQINRNDEIDDRGSINTPPPTLYVEDEFRNGSNAADDHQGGVDAGHDEVAGADELDNSNDGRGGGGVDHVVGGGEVVGDDDGGSEVAGRGGVHEGDHKDHSAMEEEDPLALENTDTTTTLLPDEGSATNTADPVVANTAISDTTSTVVDVDDDDDDNESTTDTSAISMDLVVSEVRSLLDDGIDFNFDDVTYDIGLTQEQEAEPQPSTSGVASSTAASSASSSTSTTTATTGRQVAKVLPFSGESTNVTSYPETEIGTLVVDDIVDMTASTDILLIEEPYDHDGAMAGSGGAVGQPDGGSGSDDVSHIVDLVDQLENDCLVNSAPKQNQAPASSGLRVKNFASLLATSVESPSQKGQTDETPSSSSTWFVAPSEPPPPTPAPSPAPAETPPRKYWTSFIWAAKDINYHHVINSTFGSNQYNYFIFFSKGLINVRLFVPEMLKDELPQDLDDWKYVEVNFLPSFSSPTHMEFTFRRQSRGSSLTKVSAVASITSTANCHSMVGNSQIFALSNQRAIALQKDFLRLYKKPFISHAVEIQTNTIMSVDISDNPTPYAKDLFFFLNSSSILDDTHRKRVIHCLALAIQHYQVNTMRADTLEETIRSKCGGLIETYKNLLENFVSSVKTRASGGSNSGFIIAPGLPSQQQQLPQQQQQLVTLQFQQGQTTQQNYSLVQQPQQQQLQFNFSTLQAPSQPGEAQQLVAQYYIVPQQQQQQQPQLSQQQQPQLLQHRQPQSSFTTNQQVHGSISNSSSVHAPFQSQQVHSRGRYQQRGFVVPTKCGLCQHVQVDSSKLISHLATLHFRAAIAATLPLDLTKCRQCHAVFQNRTEFVDHVGAQHQLALRVYRDVEESIRVYGPLDNKMFMCAHADCPKKEASSVYDFINHLIVVHYRKDIANMISDLQKALGMLNTHCPINFCRMSMRSTEVLFWHVAQDHCMALELYLPIVTMSAAGAALSAYYSAFGFKTFVCDSKVAPTSRLTCKRTFSSETALWYHKSTTHHRDKLEALFRSRSSAATNATSEDCLTCSYCKRSVALNLCAVHLGVGHKVAKMFDDAILRGEGPSNNLLARLTRPRETIETAPATSAPSTSAASTVEPLAPLSSSSTASSSEAASATASTSSSVDVTIDQNDWFYVCPICHQRFFDESKKLAFAKLIAHMGSSHSCFDLMMSHKLPLCGHCKTNSGTKGALMTHVVMAHESQLLGYIRDENLGFSLNHLFVQSGRKPRRFPMTSTTTTSAASSLVSTLTVSMVDSFLGTSSSETTTTSTATASMTSSGSLLSRLLAKSAASDDEVKEISLVDCLFEEYVKFCGEKKFSPQKCGPTIVIAFLIYCQKHLNSDPTNLIKVIDLINAQHDKLPSGESLIQHRVIENFRCKILPKNMKAGPLGSPVDPTNWNNPFLCCNCALEFSSSEDLSAHCQNHSQAPNNQAPSAIRVGCKTCSAVASVNMGKEGWSEYMIVSLDLHLNEPDHIHNRWLSHFAGKADRNEIKERNIAFDVDVRQSQRCTACAKEFTDIKAHVASKQHVDNEQIIRKFVTFCDHRRICPTSSSIDDLKFYLNTFFPKTKINKQNKMSINLHQFFAVLSRIHDPVDDMDLISHPTVDDYINELLASTNAQASSLPLPTYVCYLCPHIDNDFIAFQRHLTDKHHDVADGGTDQSFRCDACDAFFSSPFQVILHRYSTSHLTTEWTYNTTPDNPPQGLASKSDTFCNLCDKDRNTNGHLMVKAHLEAASAADQYLNFCKMNQRNPVTLEKNLLKKFFFEVPQSSDILDFCCPHKNCAFYHPTLKELEAHIQFTHEVNEEIFPTSGGVQSGAFKEYLIKNDLFKEPRLEQRIFYESVVKFSDEDLQRLSVMVRVVDRLHEPLDDVPVLKHPDFVQFCNQPKVESESQGPKVTAVISTTSSPSGSPTSTPSSSAGPSTPSEPSLKEGTYSCLTPAEARDVVTCPQCYLKFTHATYLVYHMVHMHKKNPNDFLSARLKPASIKQCPKCALKCITPFVLALHHDRHHQAKPIGCGWCKASYMSPALYYRNDMCKKNSLPEIAKEASEKAIKMVIEKNPVTFIIGDRTKQSDDVIDVSGEDSDDDDILSVGSTSNSDSNDHDEDTDNKAGSKTKAGSRVRGDVFGIAARHRNKIDFLRRRDVKLRLKPEVRITAADREVAESALIGPKEPEAEVEKPSEIFVMIKKEEIEALIQNQVVVSVKKEPKEGQSEIGKPPEVTERSGRKSSTNDDTSEREKTPEVVTPSKRKQKSPAVKSKEDDSSIKTTQEAPKASPKTSPKASPKTSPKKPGIKLKIKLPSGATTKNKRKHEADTEEVSSKRMRHASDASSSGRQSRNSVTGTPKPQAGTSRVESFLARASLGKEMSLQAGFCLECDPCSKPSTCKHLNHSRKIFENLADHAILTGHTRFQQVKNFEMTNCRVEINELALNKTHAQKIRSELNRKPSLKYLAEKKCKVIGCHFRTVHVAEMLTHFQEKHL